MRVLGFILIYLVLPITAFCQFGNHRQNKKIKSVRFSNSDVYTFYLHNQYTTYVSSSHGSEFVWSEISYDSVGKAIKEKTFIKQIISDMELNNSEPIWSDTGIIETTSYYSYNEIDSLISMEVYSKKGLESVTVYEYDSVLLTNSSTSYSLRDTEDKHRRSDSIRFNGIRLY